MRFLSGGSTSCFENSRFCGFFASALKLRFTAKELTAVLIVQQSKVSVVSNVFFVTFPIVCVRE